MKMGVKKYKKRWAVGVLWWTGFGGIIPGSLRMETST
jgi:hypothetical protein